MVSYPRALFAVAVTAVTTALVSTYFEQKRLDRLKITIPEMTEKVVEAHFDQIWTLGWNSALNDYWMVSKRYKEMTAQRQN